MNCNKVDSNITTADKLALGGHLFTAFATVLFSMAALMKLVQEQGHIPKALLVATSNEVIQNRNSDESWESILPRL